MTATTKFYVVMARTATGRLVCVGREGGMTEGACMHYGYKRLGNASNLAKKRTEKTGRDYGVYSVQGQAFNNLETEWDHHMLREEAERQFNPRA